LESIAELKDICRRENDHDNRRTMFLASRVSIYFTRFFLAMRMSANQVTFLFTVLGLAAAASLLGHGFYWTLAGYVLFRLHVIVDVSDGEVARYNRTFSPVGAYVDFLTHYSVNNLVLFAISFRFWLDTGHTWSLVAGAVLMVGVTLGRAAVDCWFRANFGSSDRNAIEEGRPGQRRSAISGRAKTMVLAAGHLSSMQTFFNAYLVATAFDNFAGGASRGWLIAAYAVVLPTFALARIIYTVISGKIPRRATYY
jgi:phosphatidylglycerophosphate synthase